MVNCVDFQTFIVVDCLRVHTHPDEEEEEDFHDMQITTEPALCGIKFVNKKQTKKKGFFDERL